MTHLTTTIQPCPRGFLRGAYTSWSNITCVLGEAKLAGVAGHAEQLFPTVPSSAEVYCVSRSWARRLASEGRELGGGGEGEEKSKGGWQLEQGNQDWQRLGEEKEGGGEERREGGGRGEGRGGGRES